MGETRSLAHMRRFSSLFFYYPFHRLIYRNREFDLLYFSGKVGVTIALLGYGFSLIFCMLDLQFTHWQTWIVFLLVSALIALFIIDYIPRFCAAHFPEKTLVFSYFPAAFFLYLAFPFSIIFGKLYAWTCRASTVDEYTDPINLFKEKIMEILQNSTSRSKWDVADQQLIESVVEFKDRIVREVMVPRVDLFCLPVTISIREAAEHIVQEGYSRTPVYKDTVDNIIGVLMYKDVLQLYMEYEKNNNQKLLEASIETIVKDVFYTPETKKVSHLLQEFRNRQTHIAIVVDEYGGTEGIVTIEDILEEIVGDIADEYDIGEENLYIPDTAGDGWIVDARMGILDAEDAFGIQVPQEGDYDTIAGYIFHRVGSIPPKGLLIHHDDFDLEILSSTERSVEKVKITLRRKEKEE